MAETAGELPELPSLERPEWVRRELGDAAGRGVRVALVDSGRDPAWSDPRIRPGVGLARRTDGYVLAPSGDVDDTIGHGTACTEIVLQMAPGVEIEPVRVFSDRLETSPEILGAALEWSIEAGVGLVNLSLGTTREDAVKPLYRICERAREAGVVIVSAVRVGTGWSYPAVFANVIGVSAGRFANVFDFEYHAGEAAECVAQGEREIRCLQGGRRRSFGTSLAAPHVTALAALLLERHPGAGPDDVRGLLAECAARRVGFASSNLYTG